MSHIQASGDSITFTYAKEKATNLGAGHLGPWHVKANPPCPEICVVHALGVYLLLNPHVLEPGSKLFPGSSQYNRYAIHFRKLVNHTYKDDMRRFGYEPGGLGTHSCRKGVASMVCSGSTACPPIAAVALRAGWTFGGVKDKYIFRADAGDQFVGRAAACLDIDSADFAVSPPYFEGEIEGEECDGGQGGLERRIAEFVRPRLPAGVAPGAYNLFVFAFASALFNHRALSALPASSPVKFAPLLVDIPEELLKCAVVS